MELTPQELRWMQLLAASCASVREELLAHQTPSSEALFTLCNRAEALLWHLAQRDKLPEDIRQLLDKVSAEGFSQRNSDVE